MEFRKLLSIRTIMCGLINRHFFDWLPDKPFLQVLFWASMGKRLDLENPKSFNEKLQWLKLYDRKSNYTDLVDKLVVKNYITEIIGKEYIIPTIGVWNSFDEIDYTKLPNQFVLKCNHDSGSVVICKDKTTFDIISAKKIIDKSISKNYYLLNREWPYKNVSRKIFAENIIGNGHDLFDYKLMFFNGVFKCCFVCSNRNSSLGLHVDFFDENWDHLPFTRHYSNNPINKISKPFNYKKMIELGGKIAQNINSPFIRIDFYEVNSKIYFGEITFYPGSGIEEFYPEIWDYKLGSWINISIIKKKYSSFNHE